MKWFKNIDWQSIVIVTLVICGVVLTISLTVLSVIATWKIVFEL